MKRRDIEKELTKLGFILLRANKHYVWGKEMIRVTVPRTKEIKSGTAHGILKKAKENLNESV